VRFLRYRGEYAEQKELECGLGREAQPSAVPSASASYRSGYAQNRQPQRLLLECELQVAQRRVPIRSPAVQGLGAKLANSNLSDGVLSFHTSLSR